MFGRRGAMALVTGAMFLPTLGGCGHKEDDGPISVGGGDAMPKVAVTVADLRRSDVERIVPVEGTLRPWEEITISAKKGGRVLKVSHDMGDRVRPGEPMVELDPIDAEIAVRQAEARFLAELVKLNITREQAVAAMEKYGLGEMLYRGPEAEKLINDLPAIIQGRAAVAKVRQEYQRQQQLYGKGVGTLMDLQNAENDYRSAEAQLDNGILTARTTIANALASHVALEAAQRDLAEMKINAPMPSSIPDGYTNPEAISLAVTKREVSEGDRIRDGDPVMAVVIDDPIRLWANVPERYRPQIELGQSVRVTAMSRPGEEFEGKVARINPSVDPISRTFQVEAVIPNPKGELRPGGFARGEVIVARADAATIVPIEAVYRYAGVTKVFLIEGDVAKGYPVSTGRQLEGGVIEVIPDDPAKPLPESGQVVVTGVTQLAEGTPIAIRDPEAGAQPAGPEGEAEGEPLKSAPEDAPGTNAPAGPVAEAPAAH